MDKVLMPPPREIDVINNLYDQLIKNFIACRNPNIGKFEVHIHCNLMIILIIRHIESVCSLAKKDLVFFPSAMVISRSAFEIAIKTMWLLHPPDYWEQEARWLRLTKNEEIEYNQHYLDYCEKVGMKNISPIIDECNRAKQFYFDVSKAFEDKFPNNKYEINKKLPSIKNMLETIGFEDHYMFYRASSQFTHGSMIATQKYKRNYGSMMKFGEFITPTDWNLCFRLAGMALINSGKVFLARTDGDVNNFCLNTLSEKIEKAIRDLSVSEMK